MSRSNDTRHLPDSGCIERVARKFKLGEEPSLVDEYAHFTIDERLELFLRLRKRLIEDRYGSDPGLKEFIRLLESHEVKYLVIGGAAVNALGFVRMTEDLDFWVQRTDSNADKILAALDEFGFKEFSKEDVLSPGAVLMLGRPPNRIDLLTSISGREFDDCYPRRVLAHLGGVSVPLISLEDLLINKQASGRPKDLADIHEFKRAAKTKGKLSASD